MPGSDFLQSRHPETLRLRKWLLLGLAASLLLHFCLFIVFTSTKLERFGAGSERLVPRVFNMSRAVVDPKLLNESEKEEPKPEPLRPPIELPQETPKAESLPNETRATPNAPDLVQPIVNDKPQVGPNSLKALSKLQDSAQKALEKDFEKYRQDALQDTTKAANLNLASLGTQTNSGTAPESIAGNFSTLDSLLAQSGGIQEGTKPILLPTDLLFDFDKTELRPQAIGSLQKLGTLIKRNPNVTFSIEGHTDSFGQQTHNEPLSLERANKVKQWLLDTMGISANSIETKGFGSSRLLVQPDPAVTGKAHPKFAAEVERQQLNRRVEIVMRWQH